MKEFSEYRVIVGLLIWIGLIGGAVWLVGRVLHHSPTAARQLLDYSTQQRFTISIEFQNPQIVRRGDLVFLENNSEFDPVGYVSRVHSADSIDQASVRTATAFVTFYGGAPPVDADDELFYHQADDSTEWVIQTMLPPAKRKEIADLIVASYLKNQSEIVDAIRPVVERSLRDAGQIVKADLKAAFAARSDELQKIGDHYQSELIVKELVPLIENEIWPIVREESEPLAAEIGSEMWREVSVFRFGWRYLVDKTPLPGEHLAEAELKRFVDKKAIPILKNHISDLVELQKVILKRISKNEEVRETFSEAIKTVASDPDVQEIFTDVFREVFIDNDRLKNALEKNWKSREAQLALDMTSRRIEPTINEIGIALFGSPQEKITPEFARVLRHRILNRDGRWFTLKLVGDPKTAGRPFHRPEKLLVQIAEPVGEIPYAPARDRN